MRARYRLGRSRSHRGLHPIAWSLIAAVMLPDPALAQNARLTVDLGSTHVRYGDTANFTAATLTPAVQAEWPLVSVGASANYSHLTGGAWTAQGSGGISAFTRPLLDRYRGELETLVGGSTHSEGGSTHQILGIGRAHARAGAGGVWVGGGFGTGSTGDGGRAIRLADAGAWADRGAFTGAIAVTPTVVEDSIRYTDISLRGRWNVDRFEIGAYVGARGGRVPTIFGDSPKSWVAGDASVWLADRFAIVAAAGRYPVDFTQGFPGGTYASIALRVIAPRGLRTRLRTPLETQGLFLRATRFRVVRDTGAVHRIEVLAPQASAVDLNADFTLWTPVALTPTGGGWWSTTMGLAPGAYEAVVRVDGEPWMPPPGLPTLRDEFGGTVGIIRIEK